MVATALAGSIGAGALVEFDSHVAAGRASSQVGRAEAPRGRHSGSRYHRRPVSSLLRPGGRELRLVLGRIRVDRRASCSHGARSLAGGTLLLDSEPQDLALAPALPLALERRHRSSFSFVVLSPCSHCNLHRRGGLYSLASAWHAVDSVEVPLALSIAREFARGCVSIVLCECHIVCSVWYSAPNDLSPTILESLCDSSTSRSIDIDIPNECIYSLKLNNGVPRLVYQEEQEELSSSEQMTNSLTNLQVFKSSRAQFQMMMTFLLLLLEAKPEQHAREATITISCLFGCSCAHLPLPINQSINQRQVLSLGYLVSDQRAREMAAPLNLAYMVSSKATAFAPLPPILDLSLYKQQLQGLLFKLIDRVGYPIPNQTKPTKPPTSSHTHSLTLVQCDGSIEERREGSLVRRAARERRVADGDLHAAPSSRYRS